MSGPKVWIYVDTGKSVGHPDHLQVFADQDAADVWFRDNDAEGVAFEYPVKAVRRERDAGR
jgi:hypothetical protein